MEFSRSDLEVFLHRLRKIESFAPEIVDVCAKNIIKFGAKLTPLENLYYSADTAWEIVRANEMISDALGLVHFVASSGIPKLKYETKGLFYRWAKEYREWKHRVLPNLGSPTMPSPEKPESILYALAKITDVIDSIILFIASRKRLNDQIRKIYPAVVKTIMRVIGEMDDIEVEPIKDKQKILEKLEKLKDILWSNSIFFALEDEEEYLDNDLVAFLKIEKFGSIDEILTRVRNKIRQIIK